mmetsp:Transcript_20205/g.22580  ORF Transcript_20205/g.22580 Transcript_20205/m.22580 type:complete len:711 (-) Transcript_20205:201-2333(-)
MSAHETTYTIPIPLESVENCHNEEVQVVDHHQLHNTGSSSSVDKMDFLMDDSAPVTPLQNSIGSGGCDTPGGGLFFADAILDLNEAHDIAETPEPRKIVMKASTSLPTVELPSFPDNKQQKKDNISTVKNKAEITIGKLGPNTENEMNRIDGGERILSPLNQDFTRPRPPRRPRDIRWAIAFCAVVPLSLLVSSFLSKSLDHGSKVAISPASKRTSFYGMIFSFGISLICARFMYRTMSGGDGEDARHFVSQLVLASAPISLGVHTLLAICIIMKTPNAFHLSIIPIWFIARDMFAMRQWRTTASTSGGRQAFFQALCNMALDILSRSLRRSSFYRAVTILLSIQFIVVWWWRAALLGALRHGGLFWILIALFSGKWATGFTARLLSLVASGGVTIWFGHQSQIIEEIERKRKLKKQPSSIPEGENNISETNVPEEYRTADASAYQPVLEVDDGIDDDFEEEDGKRQGQSSNSIWPETSNSTVWSFFKSALTVSFGSVVQCGLLGGMAQFLWSILRNLDTMTTAFSQRFPSSSSKFGFRGMQIGDEVTEERNGVVCRIVDHINNSARIFVRNHTDLAMCQVAAYYKSYQRAARDVAILVDGSGMEPIIHDDITTHMCACVSGSISGIIVLLFGLYLDNKRQSDSLTDITIVQSSLLSFILCYSILFTVMEPLRASIKAIYVCFAQHPQSLSHTYPLIFHRLNRISEANLV